MNKLHEIIKIADIDAAKIELARQNIGRLFPVTAEIITNITNNEMLWIELLVNRFGKLQDLLGAKLIDAVLEEIQENIERLSMIDKINKLEKLGIIEDAKLWKEMRQARNHIAHEYPDQPALIAKYHNEIFALTPTLLCILDKIKERINHASITPQS